MGKFGMFGDRAPGAIAIVDAPVSRAFARTARLTFFVTTAVVGLLTGAVLSAEMPPAAALVLGLLVGVVVGFVVAVLVRVWPVLRVLWHWATEIAVAVSMATVGAVLVSLTNPLVALLVLLGLAGVLAAFGPVRRWVAGWVWCLISRHRLRLCFAQLIRSGNRLHPASLPLILRARRTPAGERVWVWLRPGLSIDDLDGRTGQMAVACWAGEVRVVRASASRAALIRVDITRRDPLTGTVPSPLVLLVPRRDLAEDIPTSPGMPPVGLDLADVAEIVAEPRPSGRRGGR